MRIVSARFFDGPTLAFDAPSCLVTLEGGQGVELRGWDGLASRLPGLAESARRVRRIGSGSALPEQVGALLAALLAEAGDPPSAVVAQALAAPPAGFRLHFPVMERWGAELCVRAAAALAEAALADDARAMDAVLAAHREARGPATQYCRLIFREVRRRGVEMTEISSGPEPLVLVGSGRRQRRFAATVTDRTSRLASHLASDKAAANRQMRRMGLPVPDQAAATSWDEVRAAAARIGYPVALKPRGMDKGVGVTGWIADEAALARAFALAEPYGAMLVERHIPGDACRLLVVEGVMRTAFAVRNAHVIGDGRACVRDLVERANGERRRLAAEGSALPQLQITEETDDLLAAQGLGWDAVPEAGRRVRLRSVSNLAAGGVTEDLSAHVHPDVARTAERAARAVGLDVAGIDYVSTDFTRPPRETGGAICEINPHPGLRLVTYMEVSDIVGAYVDAFAPEGAALAIPQVVVYGPAPPEALQALAQGLERFGPVGLASGAGAWLAGSELARGPEGAWRHARLVLEDAAAGAAVIHYDLGAVLRDGLAATHAACVVVMELPPPPPGGTEAAALAARQMLRTRRGPAVLNGDDPALRALAQAAGLDGVIWVTGEDAGARWRAAVRAALSAVAGVEAEPDTTGRPPAA